MFLSRISYHKTTHADGYYGVRPEWAVSVSVLPLTVGSPCSPRDSQESSPTPQFKSINSLALRFLYSPTLTSIHDYWRALNSGALNRALNNEGS